MLTPDALIAYHTALEWHGFAYSLHFQHVYQSVRKTRDFQFREERFKVTKFPKSLPETQRFMFNESIDHQGFVVRVTQIERTVVDVLDRINLSGGLEEVWRSLVNVENVNVANIYEYTKMVDNAITTAKVGFLLRYKIRVPLPKAESVELPFTLVELMTHMQKKSWTNNLITQFQAKHDHNPSARITV